jgi:hypothetical protein
LSHLKLNLHHPSFFERDRSNCLNKRFVELYLDQYFLQKTIWRKKKNHLLILNNEFGTAAFGYYAAQSDGSIKLTVPNSVKDELCPTGTLSFTVTPD